MRGAKSLLLDSIIIIMSIMHGLSRRHTKQDNNTTYTYQTGFNMGLLNVVSLKLIQLIASFTYTGQYSNRYTGEGIISRLFDPQIISFFYNSSYNFSNNYYDFNNGLLPNHFPKPPKMWKLPGYNYIELKTDITSSIIQTCIPTATTASLTGSPRNKT